MITLANKHRCSPQGEDLLRVLLPFQDKRMNGSRGFAKSDKFQPGFDQYPGFTSGFLKNG
jgi:hypothetical protein